MMNLLFTIDKLATGGRERRMLELIKELANNKSYHITLLLMDTHIGYSSLFEYNINIKYLVRRTTRDLSVFIKFFKLCREIKPDIIHSWSSMTSIYALPAIIFQRIKFFNNAINDAPPVVNLFSREGFRSRITFPFSHVIFANSKAGIESYKPPLKKTVCIYNGFDWKRIENCADKETIRSRFLIKTRFVVGMVASFSVFKDYGTFLEAAQAILSQRKDVTFLAVGDGPLLAEMQLKVLPENKEYIKFLGVQNQVEQIINIFDIGVLSTYSEGLPNAVMEYMSLAKPVISVNQGGTKELVIDGITGFLVPPVNSSMLADKINLLLTNDLLRSSMGKEGFSRLSQHFSLKIMVQLYMEQYKKQMQN